MLYFDRGGDQFGVRGVMLDQFHRGVATKRVNLVGGVGGVDIIGREWLKNRS
jgi:hypothetical protein